MPPIVQGSFSSNLNSVAQFAKTDFGYDYPFGLDLRPGSELHNKIVERVMALARDSHAQISKRHASWNAVDETLTAYINLSDYEKNLKSNDNTKPVSIVVPYSYAALETILAYNTKAFLNGPDTFQYEGVAPEDVVPATLMQLVVNQQVRHFRSALDIHTGFRDGLAYGFHASTVRWTKQWGRRPVVEEIPQYSSMGTYLGIKREKKNKASLLFEGNETIPLDPYKCLPDPNVSVHRIQSGRFFGWYDLYSVTDLESEELNSGTYFNIKYLKIGQERTRFSSIFSADVSKRSKEGISKGQTTETSDAIVIYMYVKIVPRDLGLPGDPEFNADGTLPEIWSVAIANDSILIDLGPLDLNHQQFPVAVNAPDYDGYSIAPPSRMEMDSGLQKVLDFMFNSHITNVRKAIHDMFIVDPSLVSMQDLRHPSPGKYIRLRRTAWGRGVKDAIEQLQVNDITRSNIADASFVMQLMNRVGATDDAAQGVSRRGGPDRVTAAEFNGTFGSNISRLDRLAVITSLQYMHDLAAFYASHTQQLMSAETYVRAVGEWPTVLIEEYGMGQAGMKLPSRLRVDPYGILADYDIVSKDASEAHEKGAQLQFWQQMFPAIIGNPLVYGVLEIPQIFKHIARLAGEKNVQNFVAGGGSMQAKLVADAALKELISKGDVATPEQVENAYGPGSIKLKRINRGGSISTSMEHSMQDATGNKMTIVDQYEPKQIGGTA